MYMPHVRITVYADVMISTDFIDARNLLVLGKWVLI